MLGDIQKPSRYAPSSSWLPCLSKELDKMTPKTSTILQFTHVSEYSMCSKQDAKIISQLGYLLFFVSKAGEMVG